MEGYSYWNSLGKKDVMHIYLVNVRNKAVSIFALKRKLALKPQAEFYPRLPLNIIYQKFKG